jgi:hypothetical protein
MASRRWLLAPLALVAAAALFWGGMRAHLRMACMIMDTPYLPLCPAPASPEELRAQLRERIERDPGDSEAWVQLLVAEDPQDVKGPLAGAVALAPGDPDVLTRHALAALKTGNLPEAVRLLIDNIRFRGNGASAQALARMIQLRQGMDLLRPYVGIANQWLPRVVSEMGTVKTPAPFAMPLVLQAQEKGQFPDAAWRGYMRTLKTGGYWVDAYGLWLASRKDPVPLLYNGSFDDPFEPDGFDWEFNLEPRSRAGVVMEQQVLARRGMVLDLEFTGRSFHTPLLRQYVFSAPGAYRLQGEYMAAKFRSDQGLVWSVVCSAGRQPVAGRSAPLQDTGGIWKKVELQFTIPPDCGPVASVQLQPADPLEATIGMRGEVVLDAYSLTHALP